VTIKATWQGTTIQGSGHLLGVRQHFIRFAGCSVKTCPIRRDCDEVFSLNKMNGYLVEVEEAIDRAVQEVGTGGWLHITGGEPTDQYEELDELVKQAYRRKLKVHIQTSGVRAVEIPYDWLTISPKVPARHLEQRYGQEIIMVYEDQPLEDLRAYMETTSFWYYYLQPKWESREGGKGTATNGPETAEAVSKLRVDTDAPRHFNGQDWMMTIQAHKYWGVK
jgi:organic radical activating enzyme